MKKQGVLLGVLVMVALVGGVQAGEGPARAEAGTDAHTWQADYRIADAQGHHDLRIVMDDGRIEYRAPGEPVRQWRRVADGVELREIEAGAARVIVHAPGDLRVLDREPDWVQLRYWGMGGTAAGWQPGSSAQVKLGDHQRYAAQQWQPPTTASAQPLQWIAAAGVPALYRHGDHTWRLTALTAVDASAFTSSAGLEEIDAADVEDRIQIEGAPPNSVPHTHAH